MSTDKEFAKKQRMVDITYWIVIILMVLTILGSCGGCLWAMWIITKVVTA